MNEDHKHADLANALPGESGVPVLHGPPTETESAALEEKRERTAEKEADAAYKQRQLALSGSANKLSKTNVVLTWVLAVFTAIGAGAAWYQGRVASRSATAAEIAAKAARDSVYMACLTAQATQETFLQVQGSATDTHASSVAAIDQANAGMVAQQAKMMLGTQFPVWDKEFGPVGQFQ